VSGKAVEFTDFLGRTVSLPRPPERIVSLSPERTEILYDLRVGDNVVGVTEFCTHPPEAATKTKVGQYTADSFSLETIASLKPDLVVTSGPVHRPVIEGLEQLGIKTAAFDAEKLEDIYKHIEQLGEITDRRPRARQVTDTMKQRLARVADRFRTRGRPTVFYIVSDSPLITVGSKSFISGAIEAAGGKNVFADLDAHYPQVSIEELLKRNPDVVFYPSLGHDGKTTPPALPPGLEAVKAKRVHGVNADKISRAGPRIVEAVEEMANVLHPFQRR
jgi:iron complex transport system substrate-binding protein